ncbi:Scr1 family TA system antitoxin-like transcriptional regulator, partial [Streptomyces otsuchiensis]|uniref:Scr1 family TA system antitoxin-like transcriptional regulator n=1 Tax=Streptomyces otsuchiensis TaxID=2681388 RepID=UPI001031DFDE
SRPRSGPTVALRLIAADLRARREAAGLTMEQAAARLGVHEATLRRTERAMTGLRASTVAELLRIYGTGPEESRRVLEELSEANRPGWWHHWRDVLPSHLAGVIDLESAADVIRAYAPGVVPDLLQTPEYAHALLRLRHSRDDTARTAQRLELLAARQQRALHRERPARLWVLMEEAVLSRPLGGRVAMRRQHERLAHAVEDRSSPVSLQLLPNDSERPHPLLHSGPAEVMRFGHEALADRLIVRGLHPEAATVSDDADAVRTYQAAMDAAAMGAPPPHTALPDPT